MKKVFCYLERGLAIGFLVTTVCLLINEGANETMRQVAVWMVASMLYGAVSLVFEADAIPLPAAPPPCRWTADAYWSASPGTARRRSARW